MYELVHGNIKHADEFDENTKTRVMPFVLDIHNHVGRTPHQLCKVFLRPASFLAGVFYRQPENQTYLHNVPYNITQTYFIFKVIVCELNTIL